MRIVLIAFGSLGDIQPFVALGEGLLQAGHEVRLCGQPEAAEWMDLRGLDFRAASIPPWPALHPAVPWFVALHRFARDAARPQLDDLLQAARGADLLLSTGQQLVVSAAAQALGVRHRSVLLCPQMLPSRRHPPMAAPWAAAPPWLHRAGRRFHIEAYNRAIHGPLADCRRAAGLSPLEDEFAANFLTHPIVACDAELAPIPEDCELAADQVGYLHSQAPAGGLPEGLEEFLAAGPPPVYIGFGSTAPAPAAVLTRLIAEAVTAAGCRAVISRGWAGLAGDNGPAIHFADPVPHEVLFPRVAAVVHHGGSGTTAAAARAGRPQVILPPSLYDQAYWRQQVVDRGLGVRAPRPQRLTAPRLARALREVLGDREISRRAAALGEILRQRDAVRSAVELLSAGG
ncbi:MAG TPA: glycosyltransferase [Thermoanaerobaculia bacterium]|jgi:vancomycin aglycone glucosyltransferase